MARAPVRHAELAARRDRLTDQRHRCPLLEAYDSPSYSSSIHPASPTKLSTVLTISNQRPPERGEMLECTTSHLHARSTTVRRCVDTFVDLRMTSADLISGVKGFGGALPVAASLARCEGCSSCWRKRSLSVHDRLDPMCKQTSRGRSGSVSIRRLSAFITSTSARPSRAPSASPNSSLPPALVSASPSFLYGPYSPAPYDGPYPPPGPTDYVPFDFIDMMDVTAVTAVTADRGLVQRDVVNTFSFVAGQLSRTA